MATVRAYSVCQSDRVNGAAVRQQTVYSYSPSATLQNGDALGFGGAANSDPENSMRTGLSQTYSHGGSATVGADAIGYDQTGGLTPTLISAGIGNQAAAFRADSGPATGTANFTAGTGNANLPSCARVVCSTTNIGAPDADSTETGAGVMIVVSTNAQGVPALVGTGLLGAAGDLVRGNGYDQTTNDTVAIDGFPGCTIEIVA